MMLGLQNTPIPPGIAVDQFVGHVCGVCSNLFLWESKTKDHQEPSLRKRP